VQKTQNGSHNVEEEQIWKNDSAQRQGILQTYSNHGSVVLAQEETYRSMSHNKNPRNKSPAKSKGNPVQERWSFRQMVLEQRGVHIRKFNLKKENRTIEEE
jgi:hypothetical protein